jgi:hypothetical protein
MSHAAWFDQAESDLAAARVHDPIDPDIARMVASLETRAAASRYPAPVKTAGSGSPQFLAPASSISASQQDVEDATKLLDWCRSRVIRATNAVQAMKT